jgi:hypothetical protein
MLRYLASDATNLTRQRTKAIVVFAKDALLS